MEKVAETEETLQLHQKALATLKRNNGRQFPTVGLQALLTRYESGVWWSNAPSSLGRNSAELDSRSLSSFGRNINKWVSRVSDNLESEVRRLSESNVSFLILAPP